MAKTVPVDAPLGEKKEELEQMWAVGGNDTDLENIVCAAVCCTDEERDHESDDTTLLSSFIKKALLRGDDEKHLTQIVSEIVQIFEDRQVRVPTTNFCEVLTKLRNEGRFPGSACSRDIIKKVSNKWMLCKHANCTTFIRWITHNTRKFRNLYWADFLLREMPDIDRWRVYVNYGYDAARAIRKWAPQPQPRPSLPLHQPATEASTSSSSSSSSPQPVQETPSANRDNVITYPDYNTLKDRLCGSIAEIRKNYTHTVSEGDGRLMENIVAEICDTVPKDHQYVVRKPNVALVVREVAYAFTGQDEGVSKLFRDNFAREPVCCKKTIFKVNGEWRACRRAICMRLINGAVVNSLEMQNSYWGPRAMEVFGAGIHIAHINSTVHGILRALEQHDTISDNTPPNGPLTGNTVACSRKRTCAYSESKGKKPCWHYYKFSKTTDGHLLIRGFYETVIAHRNSVSIKLETVGELFYVMATYCPAHDVCSAETTREIKLHWSKKMCTAQTTFNNAHAKLASLLEEPSSSN
jgi:hypothetical protein